MRHSFPFIAFAVTMVLLSAIIPAERRCDFNKKEFLFVSVPSIAPENYEPLFPADADSVVIPLKKAGRLFLIEAKVDGQNGNLVFDTGANGLVLNATYFRDYQRTGGTVTGGITGAVGKVEKIAIANIEFNSLTYKKLRADVAALGHIENSRGVKILGLLGFSMIKNLEIVLDAPNSQLSLYRLDKDGNRISAKAKSLAPDHVQKLDGNGNVLFLRGIIAGRTLNFCFDTGAETNALSSSVNKNILSTLTITRRMELKGSGTAKSEVLFGRMNDFSMGSKKISNMETIVTSLFAMSEAYNTTIDGMLGYNFLEQGVISINFVKKEFGIRFTKGGEK